MQALLTDIRATKIDKNKSRLQRIKHKIFIFKLIFIRYNNKYSINPLLIIIDSN